MASDQRGVWFGVSVGLLIAGAGVLFTRSATSLVVVVCAAIVVGLLMATLRVHERLHWLTSFRRTDESTLDAPGELLPGQSLYSRNRRFHLDMQLDGNLVPYGPIGSLPATNTDGTGPNTNLAMQEEGNVVLYRNPGRRDPLGATNTNGGSGRRLLLQNDGKLALCDGYGKVLMRDVIDVLRRDIEDRGRQTE